MINKKLIPIDNGIVLGFKFLRRFDQKSVSFCTMSVDFDAPIVLEDFASGPLDAYRKQASFDWKKMRVYMEGEKMLKVKVCF